MTIRKPLVIISGVVQELPITDSLTNNRGLYLEFVDIALAPVVPATDLAAWNTYFGFTNVFQSVDVDSNWVVLHGVGSHTIAANLFAGDNNIISFIDDGLVLSASNLLGSCTTLINVQLNGCVEFSGLGDCSVLEYVVLPATIKLSGNTFNNTIVTSALKLFYAPEMVYSDGSSFIGVTTFTNTPIINLPKLEIAGTNLFSLFSSGVIDISSLVSAGAGLFESITGKTLTVKVHPAMLTNSDYIAFKAANTVTEIVVYPEGWSNNEVIATLAMIERNTSDAITDYFSIPNPVGNYTIVTNGADTLSISATLVNPTATQLNVLSSNDDGATWNPLNKNPAYYVQNGFTDFNVAGLSLILLQASTGWQTGDSIDWVLTKSAAADPYSSQILAQLTSQLASLNYSNEAHDAQSTIALNTLNSVTEAIVCSVEKNIQLVLGITSSTIAPTVQLQGSIEGTLWFPLGSAVAGVNGEARIVTVPNVSATYIRGKVTVAGSGTIIGYVNLRAWV